MAKNCGKTTNNKSVKIPENPGKKNVEKNKKPVKKEPKPILRVD